MAVGLPVVATDVGDNAALIGGESPCGIVVPPSDTHAMAAAIERMAFDSKRRSVCNREGKRRYAEHYSVERMVDNYSNLYHQLHEQPAT